MKTRVFLVDDHQLFRKGVAAELAEAVQIVGDAADVDTAVSSIIALRPQVVLLDVHLPGGGGASVIPRVHEREPDVKFLALSVSEIGRAHV